MHRPNLDSDEPYKSIANASASPSLSLSSSLSSLSSRSSLTLALAGTSHTPAPTLGVREMAAGTSNAGGERESGLLARLSSWSREYEMRGVPPGVLPYTDAEAVLLDEEMGIVDDMVRQGYSSRSK